MGRRSRALRRGPRQGAPRRPCGRCELLHERSAADAILARIEELTGEDALPCLVGYRVISHVAARRRRGEPEGALESVGAAESMLDRLDG
jgi:hypothetical protein